MCGLNNINRLFILTSCIFFILIPIKFTFAQSGNFTFGTTQQEINTGATNLQVAAAQGHTEVFTVDGVTITFNFNDIGSIGFAGDPFRSLDEPQAEGLPGLRITMTEDTQLCNTGLNLNITFDPPVTGLSFDMQDVDTLTPGPTNPFMPQGWLDLVKLSMRGPEVLGGPDIDIDPSDINVTTGANVVTVDSGATVPSEVCSVTNQCGVNEKCFYGTVNGATNQPATLVEIDHVGAGFIREVNINYIAANKAPDGNGDFLIQFIVIPGMSWTGTLPVTLAEFSSYYSASGVNTYWSTTTEAFNAGFYLYGYNSDGERVRLTDELIPTKKPNSIQPQYYEHEIEIPDDIVKLGLSSVSMRGVEEDFGPYEIGADYGSEPNEVPVDWRNIKEEFNQKMVSKGFQSKRGIMRRVAGKKGFLRSIFKSSSVNTTCNVAVGSEGLYRVTYNELSETGCDFRNVRGRDIAVTLNGSPVARKISSFRFRSGSYIDFYGVTPSGEDFLYNSENVYQISVNRSLAKKHITQNRYTRNFLEEYRAEVSIEKNNLYDLTVPFETVGNEIEKDPWYEGFAVASSVSGSSTFNMQLDEDVDTRENGILKLRLIGLTDFPEVDLDHEVTLQLNNAPIGETSYTNGGLTLWDIETPVEGGVLKAGENKLTITVTGGTEAPFDLVAIDSYSLEYTRPGIAVNDVITFRGSDPGYRFGGYRAKNIKVYGFTPAGDLYHIKGRVSKAGNSYNVTFKGIGEDVRYWVSPAGELKKGEVYPSIFDTDIYSSSTVVVLTHPGISGPGLDSYVSYIQSLGFSTNVVSVLDVYEAEGYGMKGVKPIKEYLSGLSGLEYVVIVGGVTTEFPGEDGESISYVPTDFQLTTGFIYHTPCDGCIVDFTGDFVPELKIFRIPSRMDNDTQAVANKARNYNPGSSALLIAEHSQESNFGAQLDSVTTVLEGYTKTRIYLDDYIADGATVSEAVSEAKPRVIDEMNSGPSLVMFDGHGAPREWTFNNLFLDTDASGLTNTDPSLVIPLACFTTYYELPGAESLADQLLFNRAGGAVAVTGASVLSNLADNGLFARSILEKMLKGKNLSEAVFETKREHPGSSDQIINWDTIGDGFSLIEP